MTRHRYIPELHDEELRGHHRQQKNDVETGEIMRFSPDTISKQRTRLGLPPITRPYVPRLPKERQIEVKEQPGILTVAIKATGAKEKNGVYWLNGRPATINQIMQAYNRRLVNQGEDQVGPEHWRINNQPRKD